MNPLFVLRLALLNTFKKRLRVILAILGIALTSGIIVGLFGVQGGLRNLVDNEIKNGQALDVVTVNRRNVQEIKLDQAKIAEIQSISGVASVAESVGLFGTTTYNGISLNAPVYAVGSSYFAMNPSSVSEGTIENEPRNSSIIVSEKALEVFGIDPAVAVGKKIKLNVVLTKEYAANQEQQEITTPSQDFTIEGVIDRGELPVFYMDIEVVKEQGLTSVTQVNAQLTTPDKSAEVREVIERMGLQTSSVQDTIEQINQLFEVIRNILVIFGIIVFIITVSSTFTVITLTLMEETRQIGFLRIMGLRHADVTKLFVIQSITVTFIGALLGCVFGIVGGAILNGYAQILAQDSTFSGDISVFVVPSLQVIIILTLSIVVGWLVGIIPARRAIRINPLEELLL
jgi:putative ABC transport system permease protein